MAIALIDYRAGNLTSVRKGFAAVGAEIFTPSSASELTRSSAIVVPGVGHFGATSYFDDDWRREIRAAVADGMPLLGICLGLQWLFEGSEEAPLPGLGALAGQCARLPAVAHVVHLWPVGVPHARARVSSIDTTRALAEPGVLAVLTATSASLRARAAVRCWPRLP